MHRCLGRERYRFFEQIDLHLRQVSDLLIDQGDFWVESVNFFSDGEAIAFPSGNFTLNLRQGEAQRLSLFESAASGLRHCWCSPGTSFFAWYRAYTRSMYAREQEISHIYKSIDQQNSSVLHLSSEIEAQLESTARGIEHLSDQVQRLEMACSFAFQGGQNG